MNRTAISIEDTNTKGMVKFSELKTGDYLCCCDNQLWIKNSSLDDDNATCLNDGLNGYFSNSAKVILVKNIDIKYET